MKFRSARLTFSAFLALFFMPFGAFANSSLQADEALEADNIALDEAQGTIDASGNVTLSTSQGMLRTGRLKYDRTKGRLDVSEPMVFDQIDGTRFEAARARLDDTLDNASFTDLRLTPLEGGSFAARTAEKIGAQLTLQNAVFTSCPPCEEDPQAAPLWQIRAAQINYDQAAQNVSYRHSRLEVFGLPVFYLPYMAHAGPQVVKRTGFLAPSLSSSDDFGAALETPYFVDLAPNYDLTVTPRLSEKQDPFLTATWRHLTRNGRYQLTAYGHNPKNALADETARQTRSGLVGSGAFTLADWRLDFAVQEASDDLFFRSYRLDDTTRLQSHVSAERQFSDHQLTLAGFYYRETVPPSTDDAKAGQVDQLIPSITHVYTRPTAFMGGDVVLTNRLQYEARKYGIDTGHAQSLLDWSAHHLTTGGFVLSARNRLVLDAYDYTPLAGNDAQRLEVAAAEETLLANALALGVAYPLQRVTASNRQSLTPQLQLVAASDNDDYQTVPNIKATTLSLSRAQLFEPLNPKDETSRINIGLEHSLSLGPKMQTDFFIGQSYNLSDRDIAADDISGYGDGRSDLLIDWSLMAGPLSLSQNARLNKSADVLQQSEAKARLAVSSFGLSLGHSFYERARTSGGEIKALEEATGKLDWQITRHWRLDAELRENLKENEPVRADAALTYEDDCTIAKLSLTRDYARIDGTSIEPETRINFTFTLKTIGG